MTRKITWNLRAFLIAIVFFCFPLPSFAQPEVWKSEDFTKTVQSIKKKKWQEVTGREVVIVGLYEVGQKMEQSEERIQRQVDRFYGILWNGGMALAIYLGLQLILTFVIVIRLGKIGRSRDFS